MASWCFQFYSDPKSPSKPHLKHHSQLQVIAEADESEFPLQASQSTLHHSSGPGVLWDGATETQTCPASTDTGTRTSFERLLPDKIANSVTNGDTWCYKPQERDTLPRNSNLLSLCTAIRNSWMGTAPAPVGAVQKWWQLIISVCPGQPLDGPYPLSYFIFSTASAKGTETWLQQM